MTNAVGIFRVSTAQYFSKTQNTRKRLSKRVWTDPRHICFLFKENTHTATNYSPLRIPWILCDFFIFYFISYTSLWNYKMDWHFKAYSSGIVLDPKLGRVGSFLTDEIFILLMVGAEFVDERDVAGLGKAGLFIQQGKQTQRPLWRREIEIRFTVKDTIKHGRIILWLQSGLHDARPKVALVDPTACRENLSVVG